MTSEIEEIVLTRCKELSYDLAEQIKKSKPVIVEELKCNIKEKLNELRKCCK